MNNTPRVEWRAAGEGEMTGDQTLSAHYSKAGTQWSWGVSIGWGRFSASGVERTATLAKAQCEFWYGTALKARQWDEMQKEKK